MKYNPFPGKRKRTRAVEHETIAKLQEYEEASFNWPLILLYPAKESN